MVEELMHKAHHRALHFGGVMPHSESNAFYFIFKSENFKIGSE